MDANGRPYAEMTVAQLKQELEARGIDTKVNRSAFAWVASAYHSGWFSKLQVREDSRRRVCQMQQALCVSDAET
jgi:hypothetical protein